MHAFWLVLTYDLLEDRRIDDVIIKTFVLWIALGISLCVAQPVYKIYILLYLPFLFSSRL